MKKLLSLILITVLLCASAAIIPVSAADSIRYEKKEISAKLFDEKEPVKLTCLFRSDLPEIPYISAEDYLNQMFTEKISVKDNGDGTFTIVNDDEKMIVDVNHDTIHADSPENFMRNNAKPILDEETADYLWEDSDYEVIGERYSADFDLGRYDIDITATDGSLYLPYCTLNDILANSYRAVVYHNDRLRFIETMEEENYTDQVNSADTRSDALTAFTYNELCFTMDYLYGKPSKALLAESIGEMGFDRALASYSTTTRRIAELLQSNKTKDFCIGMMLLDCYLADGGHTNMSFGLQSILSDFGLSDIGSIIAEGLFRSDDPDFMNLLETQGEELSREINTQTLQGEKSTAFQAFKLIKMWTDAELYQTGDTFLFSFDEFKDAVVDSYKESLDYAKEHGCRNFVIDLSTNSGGSVAVAEYMMSFMNGGSTLRMKDETTGTVFEINDSIDKNLDGNFDEKDDEETYDFRFAILTSSISFSCANLMPCSAQDNGIVILGETSSGGCCNIAPHFYPGGGCYTISGPSKMIHNNGEDYDTGARPDVALPGADNDYEGFYNIDKINEGIAAYYSGELPTAPAEPETEAPSGSAEPMGRSINEPMPDDYHNIVPFLILGAIILAWIVLIIIAVVAIVIHRKKKKRNTPE